MTGASPAPGEPLPGEPLPDDLPADPEAYDSPRATQARARGLSAPYIAGGLDPNPDEGRHDERRYLRLLLVMVIVVILAGFVLGIIANVLGYPGLLGNP
jgi:hypothetical protein